MVAFGVPFSHIHSYKSLEHNTYRYVQKADVGVLGMPQEQVRALGQRVLLVANGDTYSITNISDN